MHQTLKKLFVYICYWTYAREGLTEVRGGRGGMKSQPGTLVRSVGKQPVKYTWRLGREFCEDDTSGKDWLSKAQTFVKVVDKLMISVLFALII